jgi:pilus assembly protein Flp/PilA
MLNELMNFLRDEEGASAIEYGLIAGLIAVAVVAVLVLISPDLVTLFTNTQEGIADANTAAP